MQYECEFKDLGDNIKYIIITLVEQNKMIFYLNSREIN